VVAREQYQKPFDEIYAYDGLHRLIDFRRGWLNDTHDDLTQMTFRQTWTLDATGNWSEFREDSDGDGTWDLEQQRSCNPVNEITQITTTTGPTWATPAYDRAGNMTLIPKPADPTQTFTATYDPWNRLIKLVDTTTDCLIAEYHYDPTARCAAEVRYEGDAWAQETRQNYYTAASAFFGLPSGLRAAGLPIYVYSQRPRGAGSWRVLEERVGDGPNTEAVERQFVWGQRYLDELVLENGAADVPQRLYAIHDACWSVMGFLTKGGAVHRRIAYQSYGTWQCLEPDFDYVPETPPVSAATYAAYRLETATLLYRVRFRLLHPSLAWIQREHRAKALLGTNMHEYALSAPTRRTDTYGLQVDWQKLECALAMHLVEFNP